MSLPASLTTIGSSAFASCTALESIVIPASVTTIGGQAFSQSGAITKVFFEGNSPTIGTEAFAGINQNALIEISNGATGFASSFDGLNVNTLSAPVLDLADFYQSERNESVTADSTPVG